MTSAPSLAAMLAPTCQKLSLTPGNFAQIASPTCGTWNTVNICGCTGFSSAEGLNTLTSPTCPSASSLAGKAWPMTCKRWVCPKKKAPQPGGLPFSLPFRRCAHKRQPHMLPTVSLVSFLKPQHTLINQDSAQQTDSQTQSKSKKE